MRSSAIRFAVVLLTSVCAAWSSKAASAGVQAQGKIKHVVIIVQENRTFDNYFGGDPGKAAANWDPCPARPVPFPNADSKFPTDITTPVCGRYPDGNVQASHDVWRCLHDASDPFSSKAWMNLTTSPIVCDCGKKTLDITTQPFMYLANDLRRSFWDMAQKYVLGDHFFAATATASFAGHQYIVADKSVDTDGDTVAEQPSGSCFSDPNQPVTVQALGGDGYIQNVTRGYGGGCYTNTTLADLMQQKGVAWRHYTTVVWNGSEFVPSGVFDGFVNSKTWYRDTLTWKTSVADLQKDIQAGALPAVTWVKPPCMPLSEHPGVSDDDAANWVGSVVNWIGANTQLWNETAIFVVWDDWGGFYDHVKPPPIRTTDLLGPGVRIPFLLISPYGVNGKVVSTPADYASVLKFTEDLFGLGTLTGTDAHAADLAGFFDFSTQRPFQPVWVKRPFTPAMCQVTTRMTEADIDR